jgi:hypothetical protein
MSRSVNQRFLHGLGGRPETYPFVEHHIALKYNELIRQPLRAAACGRIK